MKRDMELIRLLLLQLEIGEVPTELSKYDVDQQIYHSALLIESGLVDGSIIEDGSGQLAQTMMRRLTWSGHDFLDAVREETVWNKVKQKFIKPGASWTFDLLLEYAKQEIKKRLFVPDAGGSDAVG